MAENGWLEKLMSSIMANMMSGKDRDITIELDDAELKTPMFNEPLKLSGKLTISFSNKKKK